MVMMMVQVEAVEAGMVQVKKPSPQALVEPGELVEHHFLANNSVAVVAVVQVEALQVETEEMEVERAVHL